jgi:hypothetical protein
MKTVGAAGGENETGESTPCVSFQFHSLAIAQPSFGKYNKHFSVR